MLSSKSFSSYIWVFDSFWLISEYEVKLQFCFVFACSYRVVSTTHVKMTLLNSSNDSKSFVGLFLMAFLEFSIYRMMSFASRCSFTSSFSIFVVIQSLSHVQLFAITWVAACQTSLSFTNS